MSSEVDTDVELVAAFLSDALAGRLVVSLSSMATLKAFKRLKGQPLDHVVVGVARWVRTDDKAIHKIADSITRAYEKCPQNVREEAAAVFSELAERLIAG